MKKKLNLGLAILVAMVAGIAVGSIFKEKAAILAPLGTIFINSIKMMVVPLITTSIILGASAIGQSKNAGKVGVGTFVYYLGTTSVAVILGLVFGSIFKPGSGIDLNSLIAGYGTQADLAARGTTPGFWETIIGFIPTNPFQALIQGNILQVLTFSLFFGIVLSTLPKEKKEPVINGLNSINDVLVSMIMKVMYIAPIGVFGLMSEAVGTFGYDILKRVFVLLVVYIAALIVQTFIVYPSLVNFMSKIPAITFIKKIYKAQIVAFSTASSMATLPVTYEVCEEELGVSNETTSFVLPLGATINMDGNAIYYALVAVFFAQIYHIDLGLTQYVAIIFTATLGSIGQAGVPGPSLLVVAVLLAAKIPVEALPVLFGVDRLFDMLRTAVNITGDASCAVIMDQLGEEKEAVEAKKASN